MGRHNFSAVAAIAILAAIARPGFGADGRTPAGLCFATAAASSPRIRSFDPAIATALQEGIRRSPALAALVERVEASDGIVFLFGGPYRKLDRGLCLRGGMSHAVTIAHPFRILRINVEAGLGDRTIVTIAHE